MDASLEPPSLSYPQLFSFQVSYTGQSDYRNTIIPEGSKKGEWRYGILEVDFPMETFFLQDRDRIFLSQTFSSFNKHAEDISSDDCSLSLIFNSDKWEVAAQNVAEKVCLKHILECITKNMAIVDVVRSGQEKGIVGLDKSIIKHGRVQRKAINQKRLDDRYLMLCPGKLFVFKTFDVKGKHVRYVTSLLGATVRMLSEECEFQILAPGSKTVTLIPESQEDLNSWAEALTMSIGHTKQVANASELDMKGEEKNSEMQLTKEHMIKRSNILIDQSIAFPCDDCNVPKLSQQPQKAGEIVPSVVNSRRELSSVNSLARNTGKWDVAESLQGVQFATPLLKQAFRKEDKENRNARSSCSGKILTTRPSRAMVYLENALDEMEVIVGSIRTTASHFDTFDKQRNMKGDPSPLRSSWDFDWKRKEQLNQKGKRAYMETKWQERESSLSSSEATGRLARGVPKLSAWKEPVSQSNTDMHFDRAANRRIRTSATSRLRHSVDGLICLSRNRDLPGLPKYPTPKQDQSSGMITYSAWSNPAAGRPSSATAKMLSKIQLSPASENLLKIYNGQVSEAEISSVRRLLQNGSDSGAHFQDTNSRQQKVNQKANMQQQRIVDRSIVTPPSSGDEEEEEEEDDEEVRETNEDQSGNTFVPKSMSCCRESAMQNELCVKLYGDDLDLGRQSASRKSSAYTAFSKGKASFDQTTPIVGAKTTYKRENFPTQQHSQVWQKVVSTPKGQQTLECIPSNQIYGTSDQYSGAKPSFSGVPKEPVTPKVWEESHNNKALISGLKASDQSTLQDPIYDPNFTGPQIVNRRQSRFANQQGFDGSTNVRKTLDNAGLQSMHLPCFQEAKETHDSRNLYRNKSLSNVHGNETKSAEFSRQNHWDFSSMYRKQQTGNAVGQMASPGPFASLQPVQHIKVDHGLPCLNEIPELVNRISKITAAFESRDQQGLDTSHEGLDSADRGYCDAAANSLQVAGQDFAADPYAVQTDYSLLGSGLARGTQ